MFHAHRVPRLQAPFLRAGHLCLTHQHLCAQIMFLRKPAQELRLPTAA